MSMPKSLRLTGYDIEIIYQDRNKRHDYFNTEAEMEQIIIYTEYSDKRTKLSLWDSFFAYKIHCVDRCPFDNDKDEMSNTASRLIFDFLVSNPVLLKKEIPKAINILGIDYPVSFVDHLEGDVFASGEINQNEMRISITRRAQKATQFRILLHEYFHEIIDLINPSVGNNEFIINTLANGLNEIITLNDLSWMLDNTGEIEIIQEG